MALIKNTADFKVHAPAMWSSFKYEDVLPGITHVETKIIKKLIGTAQYDALNTAYNTPPLTQAQTDLLAKLQPALANLVMWILVPQLNVGFTNGGLTVPNSANVSPAAQWRVEDFIKSVKNIGFEAIDSMLEFMETNKANYPLWTSDPSYTITKDSFINSATDFTDQFSQLQNSRWLYWNIRPIMKRLEIDLIQSNIGEGLYAELKTQIAGNTVSANNEKILKFIRPAIAYATISEAVDEAGLKMDEYGLTIFENENSQTLSVRKNAPEIRVSKLQQHCKSIADAKIIALTTYLHTNASTYPLFEADTTVNKQDDSSEVENSDDNTFYAAL